MDFVAVVAFVAVVLIVALLRHGSIELDGSSPTERSSPVMLRAGKHLSAYRDRPFAALRVTRGDCSNGQGLFFKLNLAKE
jgi:hypothetical protein